MARRFAVKLPHWDEIQFLVENGTRDSAPYYRHPIKYPSGGFSGQRWEIIKGVPTMFRADDHDDRFERTFQVVEWLEMVATRAQRRDACYRLLAMNTNDCYLSQMFYSSGDVGVDPEDHRAELLINTRAFDANHPYLPARVVAGGMNVRITEPDVHRGPLSKFSRAKLGVNYMFSNMAKNRAKKAGCDDGLMLDEQGNVSELSVSNLIVVKDQELITPFADSSPLNGITKQTVKVIAEEMKGWLMFEERVTIDDLRKARAVFATGTAVGIVRINRIVDDQNGIAFEKHDDEAEALVTDLRDSYWRVLRGEEPGFHPEWFTPVPADILAMPEPLVQMQ